MAWIKIDSLHLLYLIDMQSGVANKKRCDISIKFQSPIDSTGQNIFFHSPLVIIISEYSKRILQSWKSSKLNFSHLKSWNLLFTINHWSIHNYSLKNYRSTYWMSFFFLLSSVARWSHYWIEHFLRMLTVILLIHDVIASSLFLQWTLMLHRIHGWNFSFYINFCFQASE